MNTNRRPAVAALAMAGMLWGTTVPLSKLALAWLPAGWLTVARFGLAAAVLLVLVRRSRARAQAAAAGPARAVRPMPARRAATPLVLLSGAAGYGASVVFQNAGVALTSVTHAALLIGAVPVLVAVIAAIWHRAVARPVAWAGFGVSLAGVGLVTGGHSGGASMLGDGLVLISLLISATFTVGQTRLLQGRDPVAVTAVQFLGAALAALAYAAIAEGLPPVPHAPGPVIATVALALGGTLAPFTLFAYGQSRIAAELAGAFLNLEPLVGAVAGVVLFGDPVGPLQAAGGAAIVAGIALSSVPLLSVGRRHAPDHSAGTTVPARPAASPGSGVGGRNTVRGGRIAGRGAQHRPVLRLPRHPEPHGGRVAVRGGAGAVPGPDPRPAAGHAPHRLRHHAGDRRADPGRVRTRGRGPGTAQGPRLPERFRRRSGPGRLAGRSGRGGAPGPRRPR
jgi:drug/metabolite transporter (DMT)-like permease